MDDMKNSWSQWLTTGLLVAGAFVIGMLFSEVRLLRNGGAPTAANNVGAPNAAAPAAPEGDPSAIRPVDPSEHIRGNVNAPITLVEYSDFECPFCASFHPTTQQILDEYGDQVRLVYRHYPLSFHPNAQKAAEASECVTEQKGNDGFWTYADAVFAEQDKQGGKLSADSILVAARAAGVNESQFQTCLDSDKYAEKVLDDQDNGSAAGITGTPGTMLLTADGEGELISGALPFAQVKTIIDSYLE